jgi:hypothetical protein
MERYSLLWLLATALLIVLAAWKGLLTTISNALGVHYPPALLFAVAFGFELLLLLHFSLSISRLSDQNKVLAQRLGLLQQRIEEQEARLTAQGQQLAELREDSAESSSSQAERAERELSRVR